MRGRRTGFDDEVGIEGFFVGGADGADCRCYFGVFRVGGLLEGVADGGELFLEGHFGGGVLVGCLVAVRGE